ncbi:MAG: hypothetical protein WAM82_02710 [Thermoanaerobaculia bacterium]
MSFKAREIMIDVLPAARPFPPGDPGFGLCPEPTRVTTGGEDDDRECGEATRPPNPPASDRLEDLAVLRQQLRQAMSAAPA